MVSGTVGVDRLTAVTQWVEATGNKLFLGLTALAHPKVPAPVKQRLRDQYRTLNPVALLAEIRTAQEELGNRIDRRAGKACFERRVGNGVAPQPPIINPGRICLR